MYVRISQCTHSDMTITVLCCCARHVLVKNEMCVCLSCVSMKHCRSHKLPIGGVHMYICTYVQQNSTYTGGCQPPEGQCCRPRALHRLYHPSLRVGQLHRYVHTYVCMYVRTFCRLGWSLAKACGLYTSGLTVSRNTSICRCEGKKTHIRTWYIQYVRKYVSLKK